MDSPRRPESARTRGRRRAAARPSLRGAPAAACLLPALLALLGLTGLPAAAAAQGQGSPDRAGGEASSALEVRGGATLPAGGLGAFADPGYSAAAGASVPVGGSYAIRVDGEVDLPYRDIEAAPLVNVYTATAGLEYSARQEEPGRLPLRTALSLGAGVSVVEAVEMPSAAPDGAEFRELYPTVSAAARLGYPAAPWLEIYLEPAVRWFDLPEEDADRLTQGLAAAPPEHGWMVPVRAGLRFRL